jgi:hypothetical protein
VSTVVPPAPASKTKVSLDEIELLAKENLKTSDSKSDIKNRLREKLIKKREKIDKLLNGN